MGSPAEPPAQADPQTILNTNRGHWCIENSCHYILDWNYDEDRCTYSDRPRPGKYLASPPFRHRDH